MDDVVTGARAEVTMDVPLPRDRVWELVTDAARFGRWSPECVRTAWLDGSGPRVGARFAGHNRFPNGLETDVVCVVTEVAEPTAFAWVVLDARGEVSRPGSTWRYELAPGDTDDSTLLRHIFEHGPGDSGARRAAQEHPGALERRLGMIRDNMRAALTAMVRDARTGETV